jgi:hypothetical protein
LLVDTEGLVLKACRSTAPRSWTTRGSRSFCDTPTKSSRA